MKSARNPKFILLSIALCAATAGLMYGYDVGVFSGALIYLRNQFHLTSAQTGALTGIMFAGAAAGAPFSGWASDRFGRRPVLLFSGIVFAAGTWIAALSGEFWQLLLARSIIGVALGSALLVAPLYIAEVSPPQVRGRFVTLNQLVLVTGILIGFIANYAISLAGPASWHHMFAVDCLPGLALCFSLLRVPESPRWLIQQGRVQDAAVILDRLSGGIGVDETICEMRRSLTEERVAFRQLLAPAVRAPLIVAVGLAVIQQVTGINTVLFYGSYLFAEHVGMKGAQAIGLNIAVGLVNLAATLLGLFYIDRLGRRLLLLSATGGMAICLTAFAVLFRVSPQRPLILLVPLVIYVAFFAFGLGTAVWVCLAEMFPSRLRGRAMSVATMALWISVTVVTGTFPQLLRAISPSGVFAVYAVICLMSFAFIFLLLPETKNRSLEEIEGLWMLKASERIGKRINPAIHR